MSRIKLTAESIGKFVWNSRKTDIRWDSVTSGFGVRVYPSGRKSFVVGYADGSRYKIRVLAGVEEISLKEARAKAQEILRRASKRRRLNEEFRQAMTVSELGERFIEDFAKLHRRSWKEDLRRIQSYIVPSLGSSSLPSVRTVQLVGLHAMISKRAPVEANRVLQLFRRMFNVAKSWGLVEGENPVRGIQQNKERARERWVTPDEMPKLMQKIREEKNVFAQKAVLLYLLTGARRREITRARWDDVDFKNGLLRLENTKNGDSFNVELSPQALDVIDSIPRLPGIPWLIPGRGGRHHLVNLDKPWQRIRRAAGLEDVQIRDLRRTFASWMLLSGAEVDQAQKALNHRDIRATMRYARRLRRDIAAPVARHGEYFDRFLKNE